MAEINFAAPLWLLAALPITAIFFWLAVAAARRNELFFSHAALGVHARRGVKIDKVTCATLLVLVIAVLSSMIALARPGHERGFAIEESESREVVLVLDYSLSMEGHINDPGLGRSFRKLSVQRAFARKLISIIASQAAGDCVGIIIFGDESLGAWPCTIDYAQALWAIPGDIDVPSQLRGTNILKALTTTIAYLNQRESFAPQILILVTDGLDTILSKGVKKVKELWNSRSIDQSGRAFIETQNRKVRGDKIEERIPRTRERSRTLIVMGIQVGNESSVMRLCKELVGICYGDISKATAEEVFSKIIAFPRGTIKKTVKAPRDERIARIAGKIAAGAWLCWVVLSVLFRRLPSRIGVYRR